MRRYGATFMLLLLLCGTMGASPPDRQVSDNTFRSLNPEMSVKVNPMLEYIGQVDYEIREPSLDKLETSTYMTKSYIFIKSSEHKITSLFYIQIRREQTEYSTNLLGDVRTHLKSGTCSLTGVTYNCYTRIVVPGLDEPLARAIVEKGYILPVCLLTKAYTRVDTSNGNYLIIMSYSEDLAASEIDCGAWLATETLTQDQEEYVQRFETNCGSSFALVRKGFMKGRESKAYQEGESVMDKFIRPRDLP